MTSLNIYRSDLTHQIVQYTNQMICERSWYWNNP